MFIKLKIFLSEEDKLFMEELYEKYYMLMYKIAYSMLANRQDAEDAVMFSLEKLMKKAPELRQKDCCILKSYIVSTVKYTAIDKLRRDNIITFTQLPEPPYEIVSDKNTAEEAVKNVSGEELKEIIKKLPDWAKNVIMWKYYERLSDKEMAEIMGVKKSSVQSYLTRARKLLRKELTKKDEQR